MPCQIYEAKDDDSGVVATGFTLAPNGCRVLDSLGILDRIKSFSCQYEYVVLRNANGDPIEKSGFAYEELYGYKNVRLYRTEFLKELRNILKERNIPIQYGAKFKKVIEETGDGVTFLVGSETVHAKLLIGADGIHSSVRKHLTSKMPEFMGLLGIYGHIPADCFAWPTKDSEKFCTLSDKPGALFMGLETRDESTLLVGRQIAYPELSRAEWKSLEEDKSRLANLFRKDYEEWHGPARSLIDHVSARKEYLSSWPYCYMPKLERWSSPNGRVIVIADAAHAMPPSSGQGINQALEDVYTLSRVLSSLRPEIPLSDAFESWHCLRQRRIDKVLEMANATNAKRLPEAQRQALEQQIKSTDSTSDLTWLFGIDLDQTII